MKRAALLLRPSLLFGVLLLTLAFLGGAPSLFISVPGGGGGIALAAPAPVEVSVENPLSQLGELISVKIRASTAVIPQDARLVVHLKGPAEISQIRLATPGLREAAQVTVSIDQLLSGINSSTLQEGNGGRERTFRLRLSDAQLSAPGAYLVVAEIESAGKMLAQGQAWVGKVAHGQQPVDLALVLPVYLGLHRDADDAFYDQVLQDTVSEAAKGEGGLGAVLSLPQRFPNLAFTLAPEPVLLTQLRDLADGYVEKDSSGNKTEVPAESPVSQAAAQVLAGLRALASSPLVEVAVAPYASPDLDLLAAQGWRDGYEQLMVAKQELGYSLALSYSPRCGYTPDLFLTGESLNYFAGAALERVVVGGEVRALIEETDGDGRVSDSQVVLRARNADNERVTLVFADAGLASLMCAPYDVGAFCAGLSCVLAKEGVSAVVAAPRAPQSPLPADFLFDLGKTLSGLSWLRTQTLTKLASGYSSSEQPALLRSGKSSRPYAGYLEETLLAHVREAHSAVTDLSSAADVGRAPLETALKWLYLSESAWWARQGSSPKEATVGLGFAERSASLARGELAKVKLLDLRSTTVIGGEGPVELIMENSAYYPMKVQVRMEGEGLVPSAGEVLKVELQPGTTVLPVTVREARGAHRLRVELLAGQSVLGQIAREVRFVTVRSLIPWIVLGVFAVGGGSFVLVERRRGARRKRGRR